MRWFFSGYVFLIRFHFNMSLNIHENLLFIRLFVRIWRKGVICCLARKTNRNQQYTGLLQFTWHLKSLTNSFRTLVSFLKFGQIVALLWKSICKMTKIKRWSQIKNRYVQKVVYNPTSYFCVLEDLFRLYNKIFILMESFNCFRYWTWLDFASYFAI